MATTSGIGWGIAGIIALVIVIGVAGLFFSTQLELNDTEDVRTAIEGVEIKTITFLNEGSSILATPKRLTAFVTGAEKKMHVNWQKISMQLQLPDETKVYAYGSEELDNTFTAKEIISTDGDPETLSYNETYEISMDVSGVEIHTNDWIVLKIKTRDGELGKREFEIPFLVVGNQKIV